MSDALSTRLPTEQEQRRASEAMRLLAHSLKENGALPLRVVENGGDISVELPPALGELVLRVLGHVAKGEMVTMVPYRAELSTQQAADLLNVSRPYLIKLLEHGEIKYNKVGAHRRVSAGDLLAYKQRRDNERREALRELQRLGQEFDAA